MELNPVEADFVEYDLGVNLSTEECRHKITFRFIRFMERKFQKHGENVATYPRMYIFLMFLSAFGMMFGFLSFRQEKNPLNLWIPKNSDFFRDTHWIMHEFGEGVRPQSMLITAPDVFQPAVLTQLLGIHRKLVSASVNISGLSTSWQDVCLKVPVVSFHVHRPRSRREVDDTDFRKTGPNGDHSLNASSGVPSLQQMMSNENGLFDPSFLLGTPLYCNIVNNMKSDCYIESLLDLWMYSPERIMNLNTAQIIHDVNSIELSPTLGHPVDFISLLGGVTYENETGKIIAAQAVLTLFYVKVNFSTVNMDDVGNQGGTADWANGPGLEWESKFLEILSETASTASGIDIYYEAGRSFGDVSEAGMFQDIDKLSIGIALMLIYIQMQQTRLSCVQSRIIPSVVGLLSIGLAFLAAIGLCSSFLIPYGPVHTSLPFLLLGIGVDDMFVIYSCWDALPLKDKVSGVPKRMGQAMRHAGLSVTITSLTDAIAFLIGSFTILPSLRSFCLYAAAGVIVTFCLQTTLFVAVLALDQERLEKGGNCVVPCVHHGQPNQLDDEKKSCCSQGLNFVYSKIILTNYGKFTIGMIALILFGVSCFGIIKLRQEFRPEWFLDERSHLYKFMEAEQQLFPNVGYSAGIYLGKLHYSEELQKIGDLVQQVKSQSDFVYDVKDWWSGFHQYVIHYFKKDIQTEILSDEEFNQFISRYLFSPGGAPHQRHFRFVEPLECGKPASNITVALIDFSVHKSVHSDENIHGMNVLKKLVRDANFTSGDRFATVWGKPFANWVTDEVIFKELFRNILFAVLAVGTTTFIFIGSAVSSLWIISIVLMTLITTMGLMHFWSLTIDLVSSIALVLAVGLCVDFAAHIAYAFMSSHGTRNERAVHAVSYIGGAVLHGGATTLLALSVLVFSHSYIFTAFFKVFLLIILSGLFYGLVFLPVCLSIVGPKPYSRFEEEEEDNDAADQASTLEVPPSPEGRGL